MFVVYVRALFEASGIPDCECLSFLRLVPAASVSQATGFSHFATKQVVFTTENSRR